ncbi:MAG: PEP-CTERM sorting domain-containing protein [Pseudomonadales bacterium]|nr:PEP-CTERM sorting domain-containing protein [Pseudomonadales bacterium]
MLCKNIFATIPTLVAGVLLSAQAFASTVTVGQLTYNDDFLYVEHADGTRFLNLGGTGPGITDAHLLTNPGDIFEDYHIADGFEAYKFLNALLDGVIQQVYDPATDLHVVGGALGFDYIDDTFGINQAQGVDTFAYAHDLTRPFGVGIIQLFADTDDYDIIDAANDSFLFQTSVSLTPVLMVANAPSMPPPLPPAVPVPAPAPLILMALGLLGLGASRRKSVSR